MGVTHGPGPRADISRGELDPESPVFAEIIGENINSGCATIHDPEYREPPGEYVEMPLKEALAVASEFCCDRFTTAMIEADLDG